MSAKTWGLLLPLLCATPATAGDRTQLDWTQLASPQVVEILTRDADDALRETKVWIVALDGRGYVRTNDSRWLANIRRGSPVQLRSDETEVELRAREIDDAEISARVEELFKEKYGFTQRVMSFFRFSEPTVLALELEGGSG